MTKSLYFRMVFIFIGAVLASMILGFIINTRLNSEQLRVFIEDNLLTNGKTIIKSYEQSYPSYPDALMKGLTNLPNFAIRLFNSEGQPMHETSAAPERLFQVTPEQLNTVLSGGVYRNHSDNSIERMIVGLPFTIDNKPYALFLTPQLNGLGSLLGHLLRVQLLIVLLFGSLFIIIAARYFVRPLQQLTGATRKMAKGDFSIRLGTKRKDEIGQLTASFNQMAHELGTLENIRRQFVSDVSHEIQSPLTSIKGFTQALMHKQMDDSSRMRLLGIIEEESNRLSRLSQDLLQLTSLEQQHPQLNVSSYRLDEQIRNVVIASEPLWSHKHLHMELEMAAFVVEGDPDKLNQLWANLIGNAIKFSDDYGRIEVTAKGSKHHIEVSITDYGHGMPEEELMHIFKPFYKVDKSRDRAIGGNGIGLSIVKRIVDLHQGDIQVTSELGTGTTFTVKLPVRSS